jgi:hypothetical protein
MSKSKKKPAAPLPQPRHKVRDRRNVRDTDGADSQGSAPSQKKRAPAANDDLVDMALEIQEAIRGAYRLHEKHRPVMLFDVQEQRLYANPYQGYKESLNERSQAMLEQQYEEAQQRDQIVVFVRDEATRRMISISIDYE